MGNFDNLSINYQPTISMGGPRGQRPPSERGLFFFADPGTSTVLVAIAIIILSLSAPMGTADPGEQCQRHCRSEVRASALLSPTGNRKRHDESISFVKVVNIRR